MGVRFIMKFVRFYLILIILNNCGGIYSLILKYYGK